MPTNCPICSLIAKDNAIKCEVCKRLYHFDCVKITSNELDYVRDSKFVWKCESCLRDGRKLRSGSVSSAAPTVSKLAQSSNSDDTQSVLSLILQEIRDIKNTQQSIYSDINVIKESQSKLREDLHMRCLAIEKDVAECSTLLSEHTVDLNSHSSKIAEIENSMESVCGKMSEIAAALQTRSSSSASLVSEVVTELAERNIRKRNLIIFKMPESLEADGRARKRADEESVRKLMDDLNCAVDIQLKAIRIGSRSESRTRPLKVILSSEEIVNRVVQNASKLRRLPQYSDIALSVDRTPTQRLQYKQIKEQLDERVARGERGLRIRQVGGVAKIVKEN